MFSFVLKGGAPTVRRKRECVKPQGPKTKRIQVRASLINARSELTSKPGFGDKVDL